MHNTYQTVYYLKLKTSPRIGTILQFHGRFSHKVEVEVEISICPTPPPRSVTPTQK